MNDPALHDNPPKRPLPSALLDALHALRALLGDRVTTSEAVREHHGKDETAHPHASGINAVHYGTMLENVMGLTVVLAGGRARAEVKGRTALTLWNNRT